MPGIVSHGVVCLDRGLAGAREGQPSPDLVERKGEGLPKLRSSGHRYRRSDRVLRVIITTYPEGIERSVDVRVDDDHGLGGSGPGPVVLELDLPGSGKAERS